MAPEVPGDVRIERALLSADDKTGLGALVGELSAHRVELWATSGTRQALGSSTVRPLEELTGIGSWFEGRLKTLHPAVFGGILAPRTAAGLEELERRKLRPFDLVVTNFYPFERKLREAPGLEVKEEYVDIGGVSLARAGAKNHRWVAVVTDPAQYEPLLAELRARRGSTSAAFRRSLAVRAFRRCAEYDAAIASGISPEEEPGRFPELSFLTRDSLGLRYGENPEQRAAAYLLSGPTQFGTEVAPFETVKGDPPSFTNLLDLDTAARIVAEFAAPAAAVVKHATPCGAATGPTLQGALDGAIATDPVARYGCAVVVNRPLSERDLDPLKGVFVDLLAAPAFEAEALARLSTRKKLKIVKIDPSASTHIGWEARNALGRLLIQEADHRRLEVSTLRHATGPPVNEETLASLAFGWDIVRHAKSNAIVLASGTTTVGIGSGQPTRVKAVELACEVAGSRARGATLASDAFFPFADGLEAAGRAGVTAVIQPGGSVRDDEVRATAERYGISMYFTGWRVFRH